MAKIFDWLKPTANVQTNAFDVSKRQTFSMPCANLEPALIRVVSPKSKGELSLGSSLINTMPMINQPFNRGQFVIDFYQVPFKQIMSRFDEFYTQLQEGFSSADNLDNAAQIPHVDLWTLVTLCAHDFVLHQLVNGFYRQDGAYWKLDWSSTIDPSMDFDEYLLGRDVHGIPVVFGTWRLLDLLGYGNYYLIFKEWFLRFRFTSDPADGDGFNFASVYAALKFAKFVYDSCIEGEGISQAYDDAVVDFFDHAYSVDQPALVNIMHLNEKNVIGFGVADGSPKLCVNALSFYAYQKVFSDIYRNSFYDKSNRFCFNCDAIANNDYNLPFVEFFTYWRIRFLGSYSSSMAKQFLELFQMRYRQFKKDMFTSLLPNSQFGDVSVVNVGDSVFNLNVTNPDHSASARLLSTPEGKVTLHSTNQVANFTSPNLTFSVLMQRRAEALQKYKERFLRAGNRLRDQYISTFGKVPYYLEDKYVRYLGSIDSRLNVQGVPSTSDTGDYTVAERASYGYCGINGKIDFTCDDWSFVIGIFYYLPEVDYQAFGIEGDKKFSEFSDYIVPEFENLGLEPVYRTTLSALSTVLAGQDPVGGERVIGFGPAYMYFKSDVDKVHGEFGSTNDLNGVFSSWVATRGNVSMSELSNYYVRPDFLNQVMRQGYTGNQDTDPFLCVLDFNFKLIEPLSVVGLPIWN